MNARYLLIGIAFGAWVAWMLLTRRPTPPDRYSRGRYKQPPMATKRIIDIYDNRNEGTG